MNHLEAPLSDYELTQAIARGAISGIGDLYERHQPKVYSVCLRMTGNMSEAEDLTQEIFIKLLGRLARFGARASLELAVSAHYESCADVFSTGGRRRERFPYLEDEFDSDSRQSKVSFGTQFLDRIAIDAALAHCLRVSLDLSEV